MWWWYVSVVSRQQKDAKVCQKLLQNERVIAIKPQKEEDWTSQLINDGQKNENMKVSIPSNQKKKIIQWWKKLYYVRERVLRGMIEFK